jgi:hypothetical protein
MMIPQPHSSPAFRPILPSHSHIDGETCPLCEQDIPPEKLEEIKGKIALREHEQTVAITTRLEQQYEAERTEADATAKANLELERRQSALREAAAREEAKKTAEATAAEQIAAAETVRQQLHKELETQTEQAQAVKAAAEQASAAHQAQLKKVHEESAAALAAAKVAAEAQEATIRLEAQQVADAAAAEKLAASEAARADLDTALQVQIEQAEATRVAAEQKEVAFQEQLATLQKTKEAELTTLKESAAADAIRIHQEATAAAEAALQTKITEAETTRIAAEQNGIVLLEQLSALQQAKEAELAALKEEAAADAIRIHAEATAAAELLMAEKLAANAQAAADAAAKATEAETKLATLAEQHEAMLNEQLNAQREILETAKTAEINAIKAKAFEDNQKQVDKLTTELRALEKKTNDELGEGAEIDLLEALKAEFIGDQIDKISKVSGGADIRHTVMLHGKACGTILYDSKNRGKFLFEHVTKLKADQLADKADHAILSTHKFPKDTRQLHIHDGVVLASPARVVAVASLVRQHLVLTHTLRLSNAERETKTAVLYEFISSDRCTQYLSAVDGHAEELLKMQVKEKQAHDAVWKKEGELLKKIQKAQADLSNEISCIIGTVDASEPMLEEARL